jgi:hypothetical protein
MALRLVSGPGAVAQAEFTAPNTPHAIAVNQVKKMNARVSLLLANQLPEPGLTGFKIMFPNLKK